MCVLCTLVLVYLGWPLKQSFLNFVSLDFIWIFRNTALDCYGQYKEQELEEICIDMFLEY